MSGVVDRAWGEPLSETVPWAHGPWSLEVREDELADIRYDGTLVLRSVRGVARDRDWGTVPSSVEQLTQTADGLRLEIRMRGLGAEIAATITLEAAGDSEAAGDRLTISFAASARDDFWSNRLGLVVLHPPTVAGADLRVTTPSGQSSTTRFPERISPHQPAFDIAELAWTDGGVDSILVFSGDTFEMEDQRNWTDASFKTYSTPLALPFPALIAAGSTVEQQIVLASARTRPAEAPASPATVVLTPGSGRAPLFGTSASTAGGQIPDGFTTAADWLLVELDARSANWPAALARASQEAAGSRLDVRLVARDGADVDQLVQAILQAQGHGVVIGRVGAYSATSHVTEPELWDRLTGQRSELGAGVELVGGTRAHFTELNRTHDRLPPDLPALTFSVTPQMHATNRHQLAESIEMQRLVAMNARTIAVDRPVHVGPVTLRPRFNAVATSASGTDGSKVEADVSLGYGAELVPGATDSRQSAPALGAWTIASAAALTRAGVDSVSYFESWGPRGILGHPVQQATDWLSELSGEPLLRADVALPPGLWILAARGKDGPVALLANLGEVDLTVALGFDELTLSVTVGPLMAVRVPLAR